VPSRSLQQSIQIVTIFVLLAHAGMKLPWFVTAGECETGTAVDNFRDIRIEGASTLPGRDNRHDFRTALCGRSAVPSG
jgi:hypothetical protein